jgi:hypothetical protein
VEKIVERTRLFYGLYIRFGHAPLCYKYLESPEIEEPDPAVEVPIFVPLPVLILERDDVSVNASVSSKARSYKKRTIPLRITSPTDEVVALLHLHRSLNDFNSPRPRIK